MLADVIGALKCPVCDRPLALEPSTVRCDAGHAFDVAKEGYVNLLGGRAKASTADTRAMVAARRSFFSGGHFEPLSNGIVEAARRAELPSGVLLDVGAGTGEHLVALLNCFADRAGLAVDISKHASRVSARAHSHIGAVVADVWGLLPVADGAAALVLCAFAPRNVDEFRRVLAPGGALIVVTPHPEHLQELVGPLGLLTVDPDKEQRLARALHGAFVAEDQRDLSWTSALLRDDALTAALMGPSAAHVTADEMARRVTEALPEQITATFSVRIGTYRVVDAPC